MKGYKFAPAFISDFFTPFYDLVIEQGGLGTALQEKIIKYANIKAGEKILDVGCGSGSLVIKIKSQFPKSQITGVDPDPKILSIAKNKVSKNGLEIQLLNAWAENLPFNSNSFDLVISSLTLHHLPTEIKKLAIKEIFRVMKKDGRFLLVDIGKPRSLFEKIKFILDPERIFSSAGEYMEDNLKGKIPIFLKEANLKVYEVAPRHRGIQFLLSKKS